MLAINTIKINLKRSERKRKNFRLRLRRAENGRLLLRVGVGGFAPLWKNLCLRT